MWIESPYTRLLGQFSMRRRGEVVSGFSHRRNEDGDDVSEKGVSGEA